MNPDSVRNNRGCYLILKGPVEKNLFFSAVNQMLSAHDVFQLQFNADELESMAHLVPASSVAVFSEKDFTGESEEQALSWMQEQLTEPVLLQPGSYPHYHYLLKISDDTYWYFMHYHHIILDGWGLANGFKALAACYRELKAGNNPVIKSQSYAIAMTKAHDDYTSSAYEETKNYWKKKFKDPLPSLLEKKYTIQKEDQSGIYTIQLDEKQNACLADLKEHTGSGLSALSLAMLNVYWARITGEHEFALGITLHKRRTDEERSCVGMFSGVLPFHCRYDPEKSFTGLLAEIASGQKESYPHYRYLVSDFKTLFPGDEEKISPLEIIVNHARLDFTLDFGPDLFSDLKLIRHNHQLFPLEIFWREFGENHPLHIDFIYNKAYFSPDEIQLFANRFLHILEQCAQNPEIKLKNIAVIPSEELLLIEQYSNEKITYTSDDTILSMFAAQVAARPDAVAVISGEEKLTYSKLAGLSDALAVHLKERGVAPGMPVVVCMERTAELMIAVLAVLKAGAAYVPVEPDFPAERLQVLMAEIESKTVVTTGAYASLFSNSEVVCLDVLSLVLGEPLHAAVDSGDMAYIMFTSGSTGKPKGVMVTHRNVTSLVKATEYFPITANDSILAGGSFAFDASTFEYWGALLNGGTLVMATKAELIDTATLKTIIRTKGVTKMFFTTGWFNLLADTDVSVFETLEAVIVGGERFSIRHARKIQAHCKDLRIVNGYGPTENTTFSIAYTINDTIESGETPIGTPLQYRSAYILNNHQEHVPIGVTGELYLGGAGLSDGYYNRPELTAKVFIPHIFKEGSGERLYKTGDLVRWLPDGNIVFAGRTDDQVKVRGFRIEPGEVTAVLLRSPMIRQAVVVARPDATGSYQLVAYVTASDHTYQKEDLLQWLEMQLPGYMIPAHIIVLEALPLNANGKVDRKALPVPEQTRSEQDNVPRNATESRLAEIWQELLQVSKVGIHDNFFHLGGHSLMAMRVSAFIKNEWGLRVAPTVLFNCKTIERLAAHIDQLKGQDPAGSIIRSPEHYTDQKLPLSFGQERLWFIDCLHGSVQYHIISVFRLKGPLDIPSLEKALGYIVDRHEALRTVIREEEGVPYQHILEKNNWKADIYKGEPLDEQGVDSLIDDWVRTPFDLSAEHMLRAHLIPVSSSDHILVINIHHIAADGWSMSVLSKELDLCYRAYLQGEEPELAELPLQYKEYSVWQRRQESLLEDKLEYWQRKLNGVTLLNMPTDYVRSARQSVRGDSMKFRVNKELTGQLKSFSVREDVTLYMTLLTAFKVLLHRYCSQDDICVGGAISGRLQQEFEPLIGFFVNTLALRTDLSGDPDFREALQRVKGTLLEAYDHQEVPFERIVKKVVAERDISQNPLFQVVFVLQNAPDAEMNTLDEVSLEKMNYQYRTSQFDLHFSVHETPDGLLANVAYCNDLFNSSTIERLLGHFERLLESVVSMPDVAIGKMPMLSARETDQLLYSFSGIPASYPADQTIVSLFTGQALRTPDHIAVSFEGEHLSYRMLDEQSTGLAKRLKLAGVEKGSLVPICTGHCLEMMVGILAVLKAGGVYVPVDPEYPEDRIRFILSDTRAEVVLVLENTLKAVQDVYESLFICLDGEWFMEEEPVELPACEPDQPAYIIYTSGSTGQPKGVVIPHRNVVRLFMTSEPLYDFNENDVWTMFHSYSFDFSVWEMYGALFYGGRLVIVPRVMARDTMAFTRLLEEEGVTVLNQTPSAFYVLQESVLLNPVSLQVRYVIFGGEALHPVRLKGWHKLFPSCKLINMYGITETTVHVTYQEITEKEMNGSGSVIGKPIPTLRAYILDKNLQPVPVGVPGELCIAGEGLATGYLNRTELTAERFIRNPFSENDQEKLYKAGDWGKWLEDGSIEYLGRIDHQVKIRGYRIELGEIEHAVNKLPEVMESCVVVKNSEDQTDKKLVCYYVPEVNIVKQLEKSLHQDQVNNWQVLYEDTYGKMDAADETIEFDITGWNDSFTGEAIPEPEMKEWLNDICRVILSQQPQHVLEIGCGTGMIYYQLAPHIRQYTGVDLSHHSVEQIRRHIKNHPDDFPATHLRACAAHEVRPDEMEHTDTIILNSVIQYFPGEDYLTEIIAANITRLDGYGRIILGDVRDNRLLYDFKSRLCLDKIQEHAEINEFRWLVDQEMMKEEELCFAPDYFYQLKNKFPEITHVDMCWKTGEAINELTLYRFTVILHIGINKKLLQPEWTDWSTIRTDPEKCLADDLPVVAIRDMPNYRLWKEQQLAARLADKTTMNVRDLLYAIEQPSHETETISALLKRAAERGYHIRMMPATNAMHINLLLEKNPVADFIVTPYEATSYMTYSNIPLFPDIMIIMQKNLREALAKAIPDYMIPADMIALQHMPVTSNGKTDRGFLSRIEDQQRKRSAGYETPSSPMETLLADIWQELLGIERVGALDNFFEIGGDSIRVVKVAARIKNRTGAEVSVADIYGARTVRDLAALLENADQDNKNEVVAEITRELFELEQKYSSLPDYEGELESVYPMSSIQSGMIYDSLRNPDAAIYHDQFLYPVKKTIE
ncbi:hypothetical protein HX13_12990 [Chryseobacterium sp. P1-3]|nr:hypothetical protein HX13_12990 [Chryseobacterium sp. P1-3]